MDKIGGCHEESRIVSDGRYDGSQIGGMDLFQTVICNGQGHMETPRGQKHNSITEAINWACAKVQHKHDCISAAFSLVLHANEIWVN